MQVLQLSVTNTTDLQIIFPTLGTILIFPSREGFNALAGSGQLVTTYFATIHDNSEYVGVFYGADIGKLRILGHYDFEVLIYVLAPPAECSRYILSTAPTETFAINLPDSNVTDSHICFWHAHPGPHQYNITDFRLQGDDNLHVHAPGREGTAVTSEGFVSADGCITFWRYRSRKVSDKRGFQIKFSQDLEPGFPLIHADLRQSGVGLLRPFTILRQEREVKKSANFWGWLGMLALGIVVLNIMGIQLSWWQRLRSHGDEYPLMDSIAVKELLNEI